MSDWMTNYQRRVNAENFERQSPPVQTTAKGILAELKSLEQCLYWALDPQEKDGGEQWSSNLIEHAHALLDCAHEYRAALKANPLLAGADDDDAVW